MKNSKLFYIALLILPWLTVPFLGRNSFKKYLPAALFISTVTKAIDLFGEKKKWWKFYKMGRPLDTMDFFNFGPYFVTSLWSLKLTYGKFPLYLICNLILHICFIFLGGVKLVDHFKIFSLNKLTKMQYLGIDFLRAVLLYSFQFINNLSHQTKRFDNA
ncbi:hypothetical protein J1P26_09370 [Neobacillus sp. MM2021_6]|uniref:hypothetical protein n=1 Tax=Bacillaceae TaxID=186817 RepID=UPI00140DE51B|nr:MULTISPECIES: hypothetical protein [Bacillaceae]MBO0959935.1 hypothetical protein [Neobacillus sp. MM2021_6]NHC18884.1 hypothetical protein [Bacillus sp. MM2020_4]